MRKRLATIILSTILCVAALPVESMAAVSGANVVQGRATIGGRKAYSFYLDFDNLTTGDNKVFHKDIAEASILLSADFGNIGDIAIVKKGESVMQQLGFQDIKTIELDEQVHETDSKDLVVFTMGRKLIETDGTPYVLYAVAVRGTVQLREWASNFDAGSLSEDFNNQTGEHIEWLNTNHHKGFDVAARRVVEQLDKYIAQYDEEDKDVAKTLLVTGHSRGAAVSNLVGKEFEDRYNSSENAIKPYTYTFGTPNVSMESDEKLSSYTTIFNIVNDDDLVPSVPLNSWGYKRYGKDIHMSVENSRLLRTLWVTDGMTELTKAFSKAYSEKLLSYSDVEINPPGFLGELLFVGNQYQSANADEIVKLINTLLSKVGVSGTEYRDFIYEIKEEIWVPNDISEAYSRYYEDAPCEEDATDAEKATYEYIAKTFDCKRVRIAPYFMIVALDRITTAIFTDNNPEMIKLLNDLDEWLQKYNLNDNDKTSFDELAEILTRSSTVSEDIKILLCASMTQGLKMLDGSKQIRSLLDFILHDNSNGGFLYSHMPTTYYFMINHML